MISLCLTNGQENVDKDPWLHILDPCDVVEKLNDACAACVWPLKHME